MRWIDTDYDGTVIGVDEANFSPSMCGDCMVCACYMPKAPIVTGVNDSKKISKKQLRYLFGEIRDAGAVYCVVPGNLIAIDRLGIHDARAWAIDLAIEGAISLLERVELLRWPVTVIIDGNNLNSLHLQFPGKHPLIKFESVTKGDALCYTVGAASIIARNYIDFLFDGYGKNWPGYGMEMDHGSPSEKHYAALREQGFSPVHRYRNYGKEWWNKIFAGNYPQVFKDDEDEF